MKRRYFLKSAAYGAAALSSTSLFAERMRGFKMSKELKISLAQWSLHRSFEKRTLAPKDFAGISMGKYSIDAVEYVNGFYTEYGSDESFWNSMKIRASDAGVKNLLIMVDDEGDLGVANDSERKKAVENHYKWVNAAKILGCHSVRVNAFGDAERAIYRNAIIDGMGRLADYAAKENINIVIENHGLFSSDADLIAGIIQQVNKPNFGSFPDFGNWCLSAKWGSTQIPCEKVFDRYEGVAKLLPFARAVSAKSYNFNEKGEDRIIDYKKMLKIVKESGYLGYVGIEYEGTELNEHDGILATKKLMERVWDSI